jgi:hypothetical protein
MDLPLQAVRAFVIEAVKNDAFLKAIVACIVKSHAACMAAVATKPAALASASSSSGSAPSQSMSLPRHQAFALLSWTCAALHRLDPNGGAKKAVAKLVEVQAWLVEQLAATTLAPQSSSSPPAAATAAAAAAASGSLKQWRAVMRPALKLLRASPHLVQEHLDLVKASGAPGSMRVLQELWQPQQKKRRGINKPTEDNLALIWVGRSELLSAFCEKLVGGRERPGRQALGVYRLLLGTLTPDELREKVCQELSLSYLEARVLISCLDCPHALKTLTPSSQNPDLLC